jgi:hypothetical protein
MGGRPIPGLPNGASLVPHPSGSTAERPPGMPVQSPTGVNNPVAQ